MSNSRRPVSLVGLRVRVKAEDVPFSTGDVFGVVEQDDYWQGRRTLRVKPDHFHDALIIDARLATVVPGDHHEPR